MRAHPGGRPPLPRLLHLACTLAAVALVGAATVVGTAAAPRPAAAEVAHDRGHHATVLGWTSWYGSYRIDGIGTVWCVDHGIPAPDGALGYRPAPLAERSDETRRALAWAVFAHSGGADADTAAALMLALHDLMGAHYPAGRLDLDTLAPGDLAGFGGAEAAIVERARAIKADAVAHAALLPPFTVEVTTPTVEPGAGGAVSVRVLDAAGAPVGGVDVGVAAAGAVLATAGGRTGSDGRITVGYTAGPDDNRFDATATVPAALDSFAPTASTAQRVVRPAATTVTGHVSFTTPPPGRLRIDKRGDAQAYLPVAGARFSVRPHAADDAAPGGAAAHLTVGPDGSTPPVELPAGRYEVVETEAPPGYDVSGPWLVEVVAGEEAVLEVHDPARRGRLEVSKIDAVTGAMVGGATFSLAYDADADGTFEMQLDPIVTGTEPVVVEDLLPGDHRLVEDVAPDGYRASTEPATVTVPPGEPVVVRIDNTPMSTVRFVKVPAGRYDEEAHTLAGATFVVEDDVGTEAGRCTTGADGRCRLAGAPLETGVRYCWSEVEAPIGWGPAEPGCFTAAGAAQVYEVTVEEPSGYVEVGGRKIDADSAEPLAGAVYDLYRVDGAGTPARPAPVDAAELPGHLWVGRATSDDDGHLAWPLQLPGHRYCAVEHRPPAGYERQAEPTCTERPVDGEAAPAVLELADRALPPPAPPRVLAGPPETVAAAPPPRRPPTLPVTGASPLGLAMVGAGFLLGGGSLLDLAGPPRRARPRRGAAPGRARQRPRG